MRGDVDAVQDARAICMCVKSVMHVSCDLVRCDKRRRCRGQHVEVMAIGNATRCAESCVLAERVTGRLSEMGSVSYGSLGRPRHGPCFHGPRFLGPSHGARVATFLFAATCIYHEGDITHLMFTPIHHFGLQLGFCTEPHTIFTNIQME